MKRRTLFMNLLVSALVFTGSLCLAGEAAVKANPDSRIYHVPACTHYKAKGCTVEFKSEAEAQKAGYKGCKQCCKSGKSSQGAKK